MGAAIVSTTCSKLFSHPIFIYLVVRFRSNDPDSNEPPFVSSRGGNGHFPFLDFEILDPLGLGPSVEYRVLNFLFTIVPQYFPKGKKQVEFDSSAKFQL